MKKFRQILWGIALVGIGVVLGLNALEITHINIFFDGWWTLFLIVPGVIGLFTERNKTGNIAAISFGVLLFFACQDRIGFDKVWKLGAVTLIILAGGSLLWRAIFGKKKKKKDPEIVLENGRHKTTCCFNSEKLNFSGREVEGIEMNAVFGRIECDLRYAVFTKDVTVEANAVFGGITLLVPSNVAVKISSSSFCGGVSDSTHQTSEMFPVTLTVEASSVFGGVQVK